MLEDGPDGTCFLILSQFWARGCSGHAVRISDLHFLGHYSGPPLRSGDFDWVLYRWFLFASISWAVYVRSSSRWASFGNRGEHLDDLRASWAERAVTGCQLIRLSPVVLVSLLFSCFIVHHWFRNFGFEVLHCLARATSSQGWRNHFWKTEPVVGNREWFQHTGQGLFQPHPRRSAFSAFHRWLSF